MVFKLTVGSNNMVALSAMKIDANKNIRSVEVERRKCRFPGVNFINILRTAFALEESQKHKKYNKSSEAFYTFGIYEHKSCM